MSDEFSDADDVDAADLKPSPLLMIGGMWLMMTGLFNFASGLQPLTFATVSAWWLWVLLLSLMFFSGVSVVMGGMLTRGRLWASLVATAVTGILAFISCGWAIYMNLAGCSPLALIAAVLTLPALALVPATIPAAKRLTEARNKLFA